MIEVRRTQPVDGGTAEGLDSHVGSHLSEPDQTCVDRAAGAGQDEPGHRQE